MKHAIKFFVYLSALLHIPCYSSPQREIDLEQAERRVFSQNGEDGVIDAIFKMVKTGSKYCVEFGAADGFTISNTRFLRERRGWRALLLDAGYENPRINLHKAYITAENINELFAQYNVPYDLDFLSIDIDFNDFYVWQALDDRYKPRLVVIECNPTHLPHEDKVSIYDPSRYWDGTNYYGASVLALYNLGRKKGYSLIYMERSGTNVFFLRDDLVKTCPCHFKNINDISKLYKAPHYGKEGPNGGHRQDPENRTYVSSESLLK
jgi:hypothetical protein